MLQPPTRQSHSSRGATVLAAMLVAVTLFTGCVDWSGDVGRYRRVLDGPHATTTRPAYDPAAPLALIRALSIADADNESIASAGEDYIQALAAKMQQAGTFLPTLTLGPSYSLTHTKGSNGQSVVVDTGGGTNTIVTGGRSSQTSTQFTVPARASITGSLSNLSSLEADTFTVEQRRQLLLDERQTILLQVAQSYYDVLRYQRQAQVLDDSIKLQDEKVRDQQARLKLGSGRPLDLAQSQADLAGTRAQLTQARANADNARSALARLMGVDAVTGPLTDDFTVPDTTPKLDHWLSEATANRQDLTAAQQRVASARAGVEAAIRRYFPSVSINFNYFLYNDPTSTRVWTGGINANIPIFSALSIEAQVRGAWSVYRQAGLAASRTRRQVIDDTRQAYRNFAASRASIIDLKTQVDAAQQAYDLAERAYELGGQSNLDRLTQQDALRTARLNLVDEQFNLKAFYLQLLRASGRLADVLPHPVPSPGARQ